MSDSLDEDNSIRTWIIDKYYGSLATAAATNVSYLNTTVAWAVSLLTGAVALVLSHEAFPDKTSVVALAVLLVVMGHFFVRACKGYTNMIRFTTLEKMIVKSILEGNTADSIAEDISTYHVNWYNMLGRQKVAFKALTELGFGYFFVIVIGIIAWALFESSPNWNSCFDEAISLQISCYASNPDPQMFALVVFAIGICTLEIGWMFWRSPYFRRIKPQSIAQVQR